MKRNAHGGTHTNDGGSGETVPPYVPPVIDPGEVGNCPHPCDPLADPEKFNGDLRAALEHKHRPFYDSMGRRWITNVHRDPDQASTVLLAATRGLVVGKPRPTTSDTGSVEKLDAAGIVGLYTPLETEKEAVYTIATQGD